MAKTMGEVITIDNFESKMSRFNPSCSGNGLYGLVDVGSNNIRFSISDLSPPRSRLLKCIHRETAGISLYDALHESGPDSRAFHFSQNTIAEVGQVMKRYKQICDSYGVEGNNISVFATEAMRTAENRDEMLEVIKKWSGLTVDILSPAMESLFGAMGARSGFEKVNGLFMDLGGGSVQMTYVNSEWDGYHLQSAAAAKSMPYGAAKLAQALSVQISTESTKTELQDLMKATFEGMKAQFPELKEAENKGGIDIYFCGGGFRGYGRVLMYTDPIKPYPIPAIGGYTAPGHRFVQWREMLEAINCEEKIFGISKRRKQQFPAIVTVVQAIVNAVPRIRRVIFSGGGNREGVLYMKLPQNIRESDPLLLLPGGITVDKTNESIIQSFVEGISLALPDSRPVIFGHWLQTYLVRNTWIDLADADDANSARALHNPISGLLAGVPGLTHEIRAVIALTMCARWGTEVAPPDKKLYSNLRALIGPELSFWCEYIGTVARASATIVPTFPQDDLKLGPFQDTILFKSELLSHALGKKGHKTGIKLQISVTSSHTTKAGVNMLSDIESMFMKVGKGLDLGWKVEAKIVVQ